MNLIEALKTGRPIKRSNTEYFLPRPINEGEEWTTEQILSDDWQVQPLEKKKVVRWLWVDKRPGNYGNRCVTSGMYSDEEFNALCRQDKGYRDNFIKLEWSRTEFEEA